MRGANLLSLVAAFVLLAGAGHVVAADSDRAAALDPEEIAEADTRLRAMERTLQVAIDPPPDKLSDYLSTIPSIRDLASRCVSQNNSALEKIQSQLDTLAKGSGVESASVAEQRRKLQRKRSEVEQQLQLCRVLSLRAKDLQSQVTNLRQELLAERLGRREQPAWTVIAENLRAPGQWWNTAKLFLLRSSGLESLSWPELIGLAGLILLGFGASTFVRTPMSAVAGRMPGGETSIASGFLRALLAGTARVLPGLLTTLAAAAYLTLIEVREQGWAFITLLSYGLASYFLLLFVVRVFLDPRPPAAAYLPAPERTLRSLGRRLQILAGVLLFVWVVTATLVVEDFPEPVRDLLRLVVATTLIVEITRIIWLAGGLLRVYESRLPRVLLSALLLFALGAEWVGYLNLSEYLVTGTVGTVLAFWAAWFVWRLLDELYDGLDAGRHRWQKRLREALGVTGDQYMPGLIWLRILTAVAVWGAFFLATLLMWGVSDAGLAFVLGTLNEGFQVGRLKLVPIELLWGLLALLVVLGVTGWFKKRLGERWLTRTRMERGAREAVVTMTGYAGVIVAVLVGLSVAGVKLTNLALIAGALSVGIGFGLQNIFNNFVSGLILLFERPIKTNDWIVVGPTEGQVRKISIRSTQIQTFDHADVIVPNAELIQGQVTNWMLRNPFGRISIPLRVSYDSDPVEVRDLLLEIGRARPEVVTDGVVAPEPEALLRGFADSGFEFELRVFIRDINELPRVSSELNLAIEQAFRSRGIAIPYPRRDVRIDRTPDPWQARRDDARRDSGDRQDGDREEDGDRSRSRRSGDEDASDAGSDG